MVASSLQQPKVFGIGFHKTGTSSLRDALRTLGYRVTGPNEVHNPNISRDVLKIAHQLVSEYDAFQDNPWPIIYKELDQTYPGSKFVLTIRPVEKWAKSVIGHFGPDETPMRQWIYGVASPQAQDAIYTERYNRHNKEVQDYFNKRPDSLLVLRLTEGDGWEQLCPFLGVEIPDTPFPMTNSATARTRHRDRSRGLLVQAKRFLRRLAGSPQ